MKKVIPISFAAILFISIYSCTVVGSGGGECEQNMAGTYVGVQETFSFTGTKRRDITITISGTEGNYTVTAEPNSALDEEALEQDDCSFSFSTGSGGARRTGEVLVFGDSLTYSTSGDSFGTLPSTYKGARQ